jgi:hypothetical protein
MLVHLVVVFLPICGTRFDRDAGFDARPPADVASQVRVGGSAAVMGSRESTPPKGFTKALSIVSTCECPKVSLAHRYVPDKASLHGQG